MTDDLTARCLAEIDRREAWLNRMHPAYGACERAYLAAFRAIVAEHEPVTVHLSEDEQRTHCSRCVKSGRRDPPRPYGWPCPSYAEIATALGVEP